MEKRITEEEMNKVDENDGEAKETGSILGAFAKDISLFYVFVAPYAN